jgi:hypothetical protein
MLLHEDYPHTIPTRAYLRWKENYFWVFMDPDRDICCLAHVSSEPTFDRAFASFTLLHRGQKISSAKEVALPKPFEHQKELTFGNLTLRFLQPQRRFQVVFEDDRLAVTLDLQSRMHLFDFQACADVNPDQVSISENTAYARGDFRHQGQCVQGTGKVAFKTGEWAETAIDLDGIGYRDHSWGMRNDQLTLEHNWSFFNFPSSGGHMMKVRNSVRPEAVVLEGYIATPEGNQVVKTVAIEHEGDGPEGMPATVTFRATMLDGSPCTIICDVANSFARLPLITQKPGAKVYVMVENMCPCRCVETRESGFANVEIGALQSSTDLLTS